MINSIGIIQVRMGSKRLPNKALIKLGDKSLIGHMFYRAKKINNLSKIVCAIPLSNEYGIEIYRGSEKNVISRFVEIIYKYKPKYVLRLTGDKPIFDPKIHQKALEILYENRFDYVSNNMPPTWPHGFDVEAFSSSSLIKSYQLSKTKENMEHVTAFLRSSPKFKRANLYNSDKKFKNLRFTIDYEEDYKFIKSFLYKSKNNIHSWIEIKNHLLKLNNYEYPNKKFFDLERSVLKNGESNQILTEI